MQNGRCFTKPRAQQHREGSAIINALNRMVIFPCIGENAAEADKSNRYQSAGQKIVGRESKLTVLVGFEQPHDLWSRCSDSSVSESVPAPGMRHVLLSK